MKKLEKIEGFLVLGGWDIDTKGWKIISTDEAMQEKITEIQTEIKQNFMVLAEKLNVEYSHRDFNWKIIEDAELNFTEQQIVKEQLLNSMKQINIICLANAIAIKVLLKINDDLIALARQEEDREKKKDMYLKQAIFVYEFSSITIDIIDNLNIHGIEDLRNFHKEQMEEFAEMETEFNKMVEKDNDPQVKEWLGVLGILREQWNVFIGKQEGGIKKLEKSKERFENIAKKACMQIQLLPCSIQSRYPCIYRLDKDAFHTLYNLTPSDNQFNNECINLEAQ